MGFESGKVRPDMVPEYLINTPWWQEPVAVQIEDNNCFLTKLVAILIAYWQTEGMVTNLD